MLNILSMVVYIVSGIIGMSMLFLGILAYKESLEIKDGETVKWFLCIFFGLLMVSTSIVCTLSLITIN